MSILDRVLLLLIKVDIANNEILEARSDYRIYSIKRRRWKQNYQ